jgi:Glycosyl transferase family 11
MDKSFVWCKVPKAGLGNQLFCILKASIFAHTHNLPIFFSRYNQFHLGTYLRGERTKRKYFGFFTFQKNFIRERIDRLRIRSKLHKNLVKEPELNQNIFGNTTYLFEMIPHWSDYFKDLKEHRSLVLDIFDKMLKNEIKADLLKLESPSIGVHIRMGDFRKLKSNEDFSKVGAVRTPLDYFINVIKDIRKMAGNDLPVSLFTDGHEHELKDLLKLKNVTLVKGNSDIVDLLLLSKSKVIVTSAGSTFSYWSGFLSESPIIMHPDHIHRPIRIIHQSSNCYEGVLEAANSGLVNYIKSIK